MTDPESARIGNLSMLVLLRSSLTYLVITLYAITVAPPTILLATMTGHAEWIFSVARVALRLGFFLSGIQASIHGREKIQPGRNYVFVANHTSNLDPPLLVLAIPRDVRIIVKKELGRIPIIGHAMRAADFVLVDRRQDNAAQASVDCADEIIRRGFSFLIFPEGTRSRDGQLHPFKKGPFVLAIKSQVEILPVTIRGADELMPKGSTLIRSGRLEVTFHDPIPTAGKHYEDRGQLLAHTHRVMTRALRALADPEVE